MPQANGSPVLNFKTPIAKKIQAAAVLLKLEERRMDRLRLLKLLYIADREALKERGCPIIGGRISALDQGPLHAEIYDLIKGEHGSEPEWSSFFTDDSYAVVLHTDPGRLDLSPYEIEKLTEISERFRFMDTWSLVELTREFGEWKRHHQDATPQTIPLEDVLRELGFSEAEIDDIRKETEAQRLILSGMATFPARLSAVARLFESTSPCRDSRGDSLVVR
jgi:uncharacterized phage-associated protein